MTKNAPKDADRLIQEVMAEIGWDADPADIAEQVRRLDIGLPVEDEFAVVCAWLGKCLLLHKLDQVQSPVASREMFQVPDFLGQFSTAVTPVLIEVKSSTSRTLSFRPDYLEKLQNYARLLKLPLLIAWKHHSAWTLFDAQQLVKAKKNFNIGFGKAFQHNLLCSLVGDVAYRIGAGAGLHLTFRKEKLVETVNNDDGFTETWMMRFEQFRCTDYNGNLIVDPENEIQSLFQTWDLNETQEHSLTHIVNSFVAHEDDGIQFAHTALVKLLAWETPDGETTNWRHLARKERVIRSIDNFRDALKLGLKRKVVFHILDIQPPEVPDFLSAKE
ncbi:hypothetical protein [Rhizobium leguminosarum]|uniref:hypothetical protein n=1 Tax=Rhizobium leguminosarum TaxID=384 RepID=UPI0003657CF1|nr:hypothetical protein [Rhizobium leguminosarum]